MGAVRELRSLVMTDATHVLDGYNTELNKCIEELEMKKKQIMSEIDLEEGKKTDVQTQLREQTEKLSRINDSLGRKVSARNEYDTPIQETEAAYLKILESSQTLLHVLKRESANMNKKRQASS